MQRSPFLGTRDVIVNSDFNEVPPIGLYQGLTSCQHVIHLRHTACTYARVLIIDQNAASVDSIWDNDSPCNRKIVEPGNP